MLVNQGELGQLIRGMRSVNRGIRSVNQGELCQLIRGNEVS